MYMYMYVCMHHVCREAVHGVASEILVPRNTKTAICMLAELVQTTIRRGKLALLSWISSKSTSSSSSSSCRFSSSCSTSFAGNQDEDSSHRSCRLAENMGHWSELA